MVHYGPAAIPSANGRTASVTVTNTETAILTLTDPRWTEHSQLSLYLGTIALGVSGGNTKIYLRHYFSIDSGATWKQVPVQNLSTGELLNLPDEITSNTPASVVIDKSVSSAQLYKVTGQTDAGTATIADFSLAFRNN
jgi:hypothetical protein